MVLCISQIVEGFGLRLASQGCQCGGIDTRGIAYESGLTSSVLGACVLTGQKRLVGFTLDRVQICSDPSVKFWHSPR